MGGAKEYAELRLDKLPCVDWTEVDLGVSGRLRRLDLLGDAHRNAA